MTNHELAERLTGLASRVSDLLRLTPADDSDDLQDQQDRLTKLSLVAIATGMDATNQLYRDAVTKLKAATNVIGQADQRIQNVARVVKVVAEALEAAEQALKAAA
jgi:hypothetical protein